MFRSDACLVQNFADLHSIQLHLMSRGFLLRENNVSCLTQLHVVFYCMLGNNNRLNS